MTTAVQHRRGTTSEHNSFTGLVGEVTIDTTKDTAVIHDGSLAGGYPLAKENLSNVTPTGLTAITGADTASDDKFFIFDQSASALKSITRAELNNAIEQDALANVAITGGTINGTSVGATTPSTGSFTTLAASGAVTLSGGTANGVAYLNGSKVLTTGSALTFDGTNFSTTGSVTSAGASNSGNLNFTGTGNRITGDFSNATVANRVMFQTSTANSPTFLYAIPNGTSQIATVTAANSSAPDNCSWLDISPNASEARIRSGQVGTGSYLPMTFYTGGSERLRIDSSGNVGIGTSSPGAKLDVVGTTNKYAATFYVNTGNGVTAGLNAYGLSIGGNVSGGSAEVNLIYGSSGGGLAFNSYNGTTITERMRLDSSGNVGIGTSSPSTKLMISGASETTGAPTDAGTKASTLLVMGGYEGAGSGGTVAFGAFGKYFAAIKGFIGNANDNSVGDLCFSTRNALTDTSLTERLRIALNGNVGIGTSSPAQKLDVVGTTNRILWNVDSATFIESTLNVAGNSYVDKVTRANQFIFQTGTTERMRIDSSGNVGIGTSSPGVSLEVNGGIRARGGAPGAFGANNNGYAFSGNNGDRDGGMFSSADGQIEFYTNASERARIDSSGYLAIGNTSADAPLTVGPYGGNAGVAHIRHSGGHSFGVGVFIETTGGTDDPALSFKNYNGGSPTYYGITCTDDGSLAFRSGMNPAGGFGTERARIDSSGNLLVNTTTAGVDKVRVAAQHGSNANLGLVCADSVTSGTYIAFRDSSATQIGSVTRNGASNVAYNTSSDYRLKNITGPVTNSGAYIDSLKPVEGTWKTDGSTFVGLIAHEVQEVSRTQVATGEKDGEQMQAMDYSSSEIIANLIAEVQSLRKRLAAAGIA